MALNYLLVCLAGLAIGWILALRSLTNLSPWGPVAGLAFLGMVVFALIKASRI